MKIFEQWLVSYKTSLCGIAAAAFNTLSNGTSLKNVLVSAAIALLGLFSSDGTPSAPAAK
jgi:hypothetical protein